MTGSELTVAYASRDLVTITMVMIASGAVLTHFILSESPLPFIAKNRDNIIRIYNIILFIGWLAAFSLITITKI